MSTQALRVLLIEDDHGDAVLVERAMENCEQPFVLEHCECLEDTLELLKRDKFDVALLDLSLSDSFGLTALDKIRPCAPDLPIVVLTGLSDDDLAMQSLEQGAQDYIAKCNSTPQLLERTLRYAIQRQQVQTENRRLLMQMEQMVQLDPLTGVLNRHAFGENLEREWQRAVRYQNELSCIVLDIDFFKGINDSFGHAVGDRVLQEIATVLLRESRTTDFVGRLGGEEFSVMLPQTNQADAIFWAERLRETIAKLDMAAGDNRVNVTVSIGVACYQPELPKPETLVDRADEAMFVAKQLGRDRVVSFDRMKQPGKSDTAIWESQTVGDLMSPIRWTLTPEQSIQDAADLFNEHDTDSIPVIDGEGGLVGVISDSDILAASLTADVSRRLVGDLMTTQLVTYSPDKVSREAAEFLCRAAMRQVFVVDNSRLLGVLRRIDFVKWLCQSQLGYSASGTTSGSTSTPPPNLTTGPETPGLNERAGSA